MTGWKLFCFVSAKPAPAARARLRPTTTLTSPDLTSSLCCRPTFATQISVEVVVAVVVVACADVRVDLPTRRRCPFDWTSIRRPSNRCPSPTDRRTSRRLRLSKRFGGVEDQVGGVVVAGGWPDR